MNSIKNRSTLDLLVTITTILLGCVVPPVVRADALNYTGTNISGGEFAHLKSGGPAAVYNKDFTYPVRSELEYFAGKGMNIIRLPFLWEILQPDLKKPLVAGEVTRLKQVVSMATSMRLTVILDPHNYAAHFGKVIGGPDVTNSDFADFWSRLSIEFKQDNRVWFGLMNEPHDIPAQQWCDAANAAVKAIRATGAKNIVLIPGDGWSGAHSWVDSGNAVLLSIVDPAKHTVFEAHQYLDSDHSGTHPNAISATCGSERLKAFTEWCRINHRQAFLGEFGVGANDVGASAIDDMLTYMEKNRDVWVGFSWWSAGAWWGDYMFTIEPKAGVDRPQMGYFKGHLRGKGA